MSEELPQLPPVASTSIGQLPVKFELSGKERATPAMYAIARQLKEFAESHTDQLVGLIYAHYRYAEKNDWLEFWDVSPGLSQHEVLASIDQVQLVVHSDAVASVHVNPPWDPEHKLDFRFDGSITLINDQPFELINGMLFFR